MIVVCAWCQRDGKPSFQEEKEPYESTQVSHGMCPAHEVEWRAAAERLHAGRGVPAIVTVPGREPVSTQVVPFVLARKDG